MVNTNKNLVCNKSILQICVNNVKPILETRKIRKFKFTYKVPSVPRLSRQEGKAILWLTESFLPENLNSNQSYSLSNKIMNNLNRNGNTKIDNTNLLNHRFYKTRQVSPNKKKPDLKQSLFSYCVKFYTFRAKNQSKMIAVLAQQLLNAFSCKVESIEKRKLNTQDALKNRAYLNYRWW